MTSRWPLLILGFILFIIHIFQCNVVYRICCYYGGYMFQTFLVDPVTNIFECIFDSWNDEWLGSSRSYHIVLLSSFFILSIIIITCSRWIQTELWHLDIHIFFHLTEIYLSRSQMNAHVIHKFTHLLFDYIITIFHLESIQPNKP